MINFIKNFFKKNYHVWLVSYFALYVPWFNWLNVYTPQRSNVWFVHSVLDDWVPFNEWFAIPYFVWFAYIFLGYVFLLLNNRTDYYRMCIFLYTGMTVSLIIYTFFPNGQNLRVDYSRLGRDNLLIQCLKLLQSSDTPYNVFPSIHCLNSIGMSIALAKNEWMKKHKWIIHISNVLTVLICLSTAFVKQHSVLDIIGALILSVFLYLLAYVVYNPQKKKEKCQV